MLITKRTTTSSVMRYTLLSLKLLLYGYLAYLLLFLATEFDPVNPAVRPPFVIFVVSWIDLFIHEGGHFIFRILGKFLYILGGSLTQVMLPALLAYVTFRRDRRWIGLPLFWTGENLVNVSVYIEDAPYKRLHLLAKGLIHDWNWLLDGDPTSAEILGGTVHWLGILVCAAAIGLGVWFAISIFREGDEAPPPVLE
ncbi:MAG: hypothetical protein WB699_05385 [Bacteroidota bacterium]